MLSGNPDITVSSKFVLCRTRERVGDWRACYSFLFFIFPSEELDPAVTVYAGMFLNAAIPLDRMDWSTQALSTSGL